MKKIIAMVFSLSMLSLVAGPSSKGMPVAEGYPAWTGVVDKNHLGGRLLCPSDLRHRITVIVEFEASDARVQIVKAAKLFSLTGLASIDKDTDWATFVPKRDVMLVFVAKGTMMPKDLTEALKKGGEGDDEIEALKAAQVPFYVNVTYPGAPEMEGSYPYVYALPPLGATAVYHQAYDDSTTISSIKELLAAQHDQLQGWKPYYGFATEPKSVKTLAKCIANGKSFQPTYAEVKKLITAGKDAEQKREGQIIYDALEQTRSDLIYKIKMEVASYPFLAAYDIATLMKHWPTSKKYVADASAKLKAMPELKSIAAMYGKLRRWSSSEFQCKPAEAKKIAIELAKYKKMVAAMKDVKNPMVQKAVEIVTSMLEAASSNIQAK